MIRLGSVADDLTGATTAAAILAHSGISAIAYWDLDAAQKAAPTDAEAVLLSTASRAMPSKDAYAAVRRATEILKSFKVQYFQKRIDTTLRGEIGVEMDAMLDVLGDDYLAVIVPSVPQNHRIVIGGYSLIDGDLLARTEVSRDVQTPVNESFIPRLLAGQTRRKVAQLTADCLTEGEENMANRIRSMYDSGVRVVVADAVRQEDIRLIAAACCRSGLPILSVDPGPFTACLYGALQPEPQPAPSEKPERKGTVLVVVGSTTQVSRRQIDVLCENVRNIRVPIHTERFLREGKERDEEIARVAEEALRLLRMERPPHAIVLDASTRAARFSEAEEALRSEIRGRDGTEPVGGCLGLLLRRILSYPERAQVSGLYMTGGDTMAAVLTHLDGACVRVNDYIVPQVDVCRLGGGPLDGMILVSKGGLVGDDQVAVTIVRKIRQEAAREGLSFEKDKQE